MPYYLKSVAADDNSVELSILPIEVGANIGDYLEWSGFATADTDYAMVGISTSFHSLFISRPTDMRFRPDNRSSHNFTSNYNQPGYGVDFVARIERVAANTWECFLDGQSLGTITDSLNFIFDQLFKLSGNGRVLEGGFYYCEISTSGGTPTNRWEADASGGTGSTLHDTIGTLDASLENFPTDDSQWVFYSAASGVTADVTATIQAPTFSASANATLPQPSADVAYTVSAPTFSASADVTLPQPSADIIYTVSAPVFSADASPSLPQPIADAAFDVPAPTFSANASATIPGFNATVDFSVSKPEFAATASATQPQPSADVSFTVSAPEFASTASATLPNPVGDIDFTIAEPQFSALASATEPGYNANVAFSVGEPTFSAAAIATLPQPDASVSLAASEPIFSVVAIVGGIAIIVDNETNINAPVLSSNVDVPALSTNINA